MTAQKEEWVQVGLWRHLIAGERDLTFFISVIYNTKSNWWGVGGKTKEKNTSNQMHTCQHLEIRNQDTVIIALLNLSAATDQMF